MKLKILIAILSLILTVNVFADLVIGNPRGDVRITEFLDYQCPHCQRMAAMLAVLSKRNHNIKIVLKPIAALNWLSYLEALAVIAADKQHKAEILHNYFFYAMPNSEGSIFLQAKKAGVNIKFLSHDMTEDSVKKILDENLALFFSTGYKNVPLTQVQDAKNQLKPIAFEGEIDYQVLGNAVLRMEKKKNVKVF